jgi:hypothetical protein
MRTRSLLFVGVVAWLASGCATPHRKVDMEFSGMNEDLDVEVDYDGATGTQDTSVERERVRARFAFGRDDDVLGYFQILLEDFEFTSVELLPFGVPPPATRAWEVDLYGIGGGVKGTRRVNSDEQKVAVVVPYRFDLSLLGGQEDGVLGDATVAYLELQVDLGVGVNWQGIQPSVGASLSSLFGYVALDTPYDDATLEATNFGVFSELLYKHPEVPVYVRLRGTVGDIERAEFGVGVTY